MANIQISNLSFQYEGSFDTIFDQVNLHLDTTWKLGFIGRNGRGKTTFLKILAGQLPCKGKIHASVPMLYFPYAMSNVHKWLLKSPKQLIHWLKIGR